MAQPPSDGPRAGYTDAQVDYLIAHTSAFDTDMGLEVLDGLSTMNVVRDISEWMSAGEVRRQNFAAIHMTASFELSIELDWGNTIVRPWMDLTGPISATATDLTTMRFYQGAYYVDAPEEDLAEEPPKWDVTGYDVLSILDDEIGDDYSIGKGELYLARAEQILLERGVTKYHIDYDAHASVAATPKVWLHDERQTWLGVVNYCMDAIGYQGVWTDWTGEFQLRAYRSPADRSPEMTLRGDTLRGATPDTLLTQRRRRRRDYYNAYNRWVFYQSNLTEVQPVDGNGRYEYENLNVGPTSVERRGGRTITRPPEGVDVADHAALVAYAKRIIDGDIQLPTKILIETAPIPRIWHMDVYQVEDSQLGAGLKVLGAAWTQNLDGSDAVHEWTVVD